MIRAVPESDPDRLWTAEHEGAVEAEHRRLARLALGWTWLLLFSAAVAFTALLIWAVLHLPVGV